MRFFPGKYLATAPRRRALGPTLSGALLLIAGCAAWGPVTAVDGRDSHVSLPTGSRYAYQTRLPADQPVPRPWIDPTQGGRPPSAAVAPAFHHQATWCRQGPCPQTAPDAWPQPLGAGFLLDLENRLLAPDGCLAATMLRMERFGERVCWDYANFYTRCDTAQWMLVTLGIGAVLANTTLDQKFQDWHHTRVRSATSDDLAAAFKILGEGPIWIPATAAVAILSPYLDFCPEGAWLGDWACRSTRSFLVGGPVVLLLQSGLGGSRPGEGTGSPWRPFHDNNSVSGHSFVGAVVCLNAAMATDCWALKAAFYGLSVLPAWSRVNDDAHFLSQALLGWSIAYFAALAVDRTERHGPPLWVLGPYVQLDGEVGISLTGRF